MLIRIFLFRLNLLKGQVCYEAINLCLKVFIDFSALECNFNQIFITQKAFDSNL
jgi:hypothetical protein